jgi:hypothetical protein
MHRIWLGLAFAALTAKSVPAQDYSRNFVGCAKKLGMQPNVSYAHRLQSEPNRILRGWYFTSEHQQIAFSDCVARKAAVAPKPSAKGPPLVSR